MGRENQHLGKVIGLLRSRFYRLQLTHNRHLKVNVTVEECVIIHMIRFYSKPTIQDISMNTNKDKSVVLRMIDSLEKKGLVIRTVNEEDRREKLLSLTSMGEELSEQSLQIKSEIAHAATQGISDEDLRTFYKVAGKIQANLDKLVKG